MPGPFYFSLTALKWNYTNFFNALFFFFPRIIKELTLTEQCLTSQPGWIKYILLIFPSLQELFPHSSRWYKVKYRSLMWALFRELLNKKEKAIFILQKAKILQVPRMNVLAIIKMKSTCFDTLRRWNSFLYLVFLRQLDGKTSEGRRERRKNEQSVSSRVEAPWQRRSGLKRTNQSKQKPCHTSTLTPDTLDSPPDKYCRSDWRTNGALVRLLWTFFLFTLVKNRLLTLLFFLQVWREKHVERKKKNKKNMTRRECDWILSFIFCALVNHSHQDASRGASRSVSWRLNNNLFSHGRE